MRWLIATVFMLIFSAASLVEAFARSVDQP